MTLDLFTPIVPKERWHPIYSLLLHESHAAERAVLASWAEGFRDRDGKFVKEFQLSFEPSFWELYVYAALRLLGFTCDLSTPYPDFVTRSPAELSVEAGIALPAQGEAGAIGYGMPDVPEDFTSFNIGASIRLSNTISSKAKRFRELYSKLPQVKGKPFVVAVAAFDRPLAHLAASRALLATLYGLYFDEEATPSDATNVVSYEVSAAPKSASASVPMGLFWNEEYSDISVVLYSPLVTWGKVRALASNADASTVFTTFYPNQESLIPIVRQTPKSQYSEHLLDGLYLVRNPHAKHPLPPGALSHPRMAVFDMAPDGEILPTIPDDFLLARFLHTARNASESSGFLEQIRHWRGHT